MAFLHKRQPQWGQFCRSSSAWQPSIIVRPSSFLLWDSGTHKVSRILKFKWARGNRRYDCDLKPMASERNSSINPKTVEQIDPNWCKSTPTRLPIRDPGKFQMWGCCKPNTASIHQYVIVAKLYEKINEKSTFPEADDSVSETPHISLLYVDVRILRYPIQQTPKIMNIATKHMQCFQRLGEFQSISAETTGSGIVVFNRSTDHRTFTIVLLLTNKIHECRDCAIHVQIPVMKPFVWGATISVHSVCIKADSPKFCLLVILGIHPD